jgi:hypothetical protein
MAPRLYKCSTNSSTTLQASIPPSSFSCFQLSPPAFQQSPHLLLQPTQHSPTSPTLPKNAIKSKTEPKVANFPQSFATPAFNLITISSAPFIRKAQLLQRYITLSRRLFVTVQPSWIELFIALSRYRDVKMRGSECEATDFCLCFVSLDVFVRQKSARFSIDTDDAQPASRKVFKLWNFTGFFGFFFLCTRHDWANVMTAAVKWDSQGEARRSTALKGGVIRGLGGDSRTIYHQAVRE